MMALSLAVAFLIRAVLVLLFLPFSALDKIFNFKGAVGQAEGTLHGRPLAIAAILVGLFIEVVMSLCILTGFADRVAAFVLAGYCGVTALLWKQFWRPGDFWTSSSGQARGLFWDFLKNFALAAGFLFITFGTDARSVHRFFEAPLSSTHPYHLVQETLNRDSR
jgi:putative oxidoreductase